MKRLLLGAAIAVSTATASYASTLTDAFTSFIVLGDSLSDNGNLVPTGLAPPPPYSDGKFTNGDVWNEAIAQEFISAGKLSANFAFGGAATAGGSFAPPSLDEQVFLTFSSIPAAQFGDNPLFSIWAGANDIFGALESGTPEIAPAVGTAAANNIAATITTLSGLGVDDFLVFNLPDLSQTPAYPFDINASIATSAFNMQLSNNLGGLRTTLGVNIVEVDIEALFADATGNPAAFGLTDTRFPCIFNLASCDTSLFFDTVHPTAFGHSIVEDFARSALEESLAPVPLPAALPMLLAAFGAFGLIGRRRKAA